jgi:hypothetical protein
MGDLLKLIGGLLVVAWLLGSVDAIDFRLCIGKPGTCNKATKAQP